MPTFVLLESCERLQAWVADGVPISSGTVLTHIVNRHTEDRVALGEYPSFDPSASLPCFVGIDFRVDTWRVGKRVSLDFTAGQHDCPRAERADGPWTARHGREILAAFAFRRSIHATSCVWDEWSHRHLLKIPTPWAPRPSTSPVGKDVDRYVPGLYWMNYFSDAYAQARGVDLEAVGRELDAECTRLGDGTLLTLYDSPARWSDHAERIDDFLQAHPSFFSLRHVPRRVIHTPMELNDYMRTVGKEWP